MADPCLIGKPFRRRGDEASWEMLSLAVNGTFEQEWDECVGSISGECDVRSEELAGRKTMYKKSMNLRLGATEEPSIKPSSLQTPRLLLYTSVQIYYRFSLSNLEPISLHNGSPDWNLR